ncbi:MAG: hypothetical protein M3Q13_00180 [Pseudomonadota bacterium]|nr:hypothetical protein [Pseudomonadota bacterium]
MLSVENPAFAPGFSFPQSEQASFNEISFNQASRNQASFNQASLNQALPQHPGLVAQRT